MNQIKQSGDEKIMFLFWKKNGNHTISIYENCMTSIFLMARTKTFPRNFEIA